MRRLWWFQHPNLFEETECHIEMKTPIVPPLSFGLPGEGMYCSSHLEIIVDQGIRTVQHYFTTPEIGCQPMLGSGWLCQVVQPANANKSRNHHKPSINMPVNDYVHLWLALSWGLSFGLIYTYALKEQNTQKYDEKWRKTMRLVPINQQPRRFYMRNHRVPQTDAALS